MYVQHRMFHQVNQNEAKASQVKPERTPGSNIGHSYSKLESEQPGLSSIPSPSTPVRGKILEPFTAQPLQKNDGQPVTNKAPGKPGLLTRVFHAICELFTFTPVTKMMGLPNLGSTCYMNSALQVFFNTPDFKTIITAKPKAHQGETPDHFETRKAIHSTMRELLNLYQQGVGPKDLMLLSLIQTLDVQVRTSKWSNELAEGGQQDAATFFSVMLDNVLNVKAETYTIKSKTDEVNGVQTKTDTLEAHPLISISPPLAGQKDHTLQTLLGNYFKKEDLELKGYNEVTTQIVLKDPPEVLSLQIKRSQYNVEKGAYELNTELIEIPPGGIIYVPIDDPDQPGGATTAAYQLTSAVIHHDNPSTELNGQRIRQAGTSGHYTAIVRQDNSPEAKDDPKFPKGY